MSRWKALLLAAVLLLLPSPLAAQTFEVTAPRANLRAGPGASYDIIGNLAQGEKFEVTGSQGEWVKVLWLNREGWVHRSLGRLVGESRRDIGVTPTPAARPASRLYGNSFAIVVGINNYRNPALKLQYAVNDARAIRASLVKLGFAEGNIIYLLDGQATGPAIRTAFNTLIGRTREQDRVFVFFATHGVTLDVPGGGQMGYLLPVEGEPANIVGTGIPMSEMKDLARLLPAKHVFFAVDACFSGLLATRNVPRPEARVDPAFLTRGRLRQVLTAGERDQPVLEEAGHGLFTQRLLEALEGEADAFPRDGILTAMEIAAFVQGRVQVASLNRQTPFFGTMEGVGQFVFELPGALRPAPPPPAGAPDTSCKPIAGRTSSSARWWSGWLDLDTPVDFARGDRLRLTVGGTANKILVRLLPKGESPDESVGIIGGPITVPGSLIVDVVLQTDRKGITQISVHGGPNPWGEFALGRGNGPATLEAAELCRR